jgi:ferredoxin
MTVSKRIVLHFPPQLVEQPIIYHLTKDYNLVFNILKASLTPKEEGVMALVLSGELEDYQKGMAYLSQAGVKIEPLSQNVSRNEEKCTHCGACLTICPSHAFVVEPKTWRINFLEDKCIACGLCLKACPPRAMEVSFA